MITMTADIATSASVSQKEKLVAALTAWWAAEKLEAETLGATNSSSDKKVSILTPVIEIDSHRAVRALLEIEKIINAEVPERLIKAGGYTSFDELVGDLIPKIELLLTKEAKNA